LIKVTTKGYHYNDKGELIMSDGKILEKPGIPSKIHRRIAWFIVWFIFFLGIGIGILIMMWLL